MCHSLSSSKPNSTLVATGNSQESDGCSIGAMEVAERAAQLTALKILDFPAPFFPTRTVIGRMSPIVTSTHDLKFRILMYFSIVWARLPSPRSDSTSEYGSPSDRETLPCIGARRQPAP